MEMLFVASVTLGLPIALLDTRRLDELDTWEIQSMCDTPWRAREFNNHALLLYFDHHFEPCVRESGGDKAPISYPSTVFTILDVLKDVAELLSAPDELPYYWNFWDIQCLDDSRLKFYLRSQDVVHFYQHAEEPIPIAVIVSVVASAAELRWLQPNLVIEDFQTHLYKPLNPVYNIYVFQPQSRRSVARGSIANILKPWLGGLALNTLTAVIPFLYQDGRMVVVSMQHNMFAVYYATETLDDGEMKFFQDLAESWTQSLRAVAYGYHGFGKLSKGEQTRIREAMRCKTLRATFVRKSRLVASPHVSVQSMALLYNVLTSLYHYGPEQVYETDASGVAVTPEPLQVRFSSLFCGGG
jgi:hypothetical protein